MPKTALTENLSAFCMFTLLTKQCQPGFSVTQFLSFEISAMYENYRYYDHPHLLQSADVKNY